SLVLAGWQVVLGHDLASLRQHLSQQCRRFLMLSKLAQPAPLVAAQVGFGEEPEGGELHSGGSGLPSSNATSYRISCFSISHLLRPIEHGEMQGASARRLRPRFVSTHKQWRRTVNACH